MSTIYRISHSIKSPMASLPTYHPKPGTEYKYRLKAIFAELRSSSPSTYRQVMDAIYTQLNVSRMTVYRWGVLKHDSTSVKGAAKDIPCGALDLIVAVLNWYGYVVSLEGVKNFVFE